MSYTTATGYSTRHIYGGLYHSSSGNNGRYRFGGNHSWLVDTIPVVEVVDITDPTVLMLTVATGDVLVTLLFLCLPAG